MEYNPTVQEGYNNRLKNKLFGLLCEREKGREWEKFLDSILIELDGFDVNERSIIYYEVYHKLSAARFLSYEWFRTTIFDCMSLLSHMEGDQSDGVL